MKTFKTLSLLAFLAFCLSSCGGGSPADKAAATMCKCAKPLVGMMEELEKNPEKREEIAEKNKGTLEKLESCTIDIEAQIKEKGDEFGDEILEKMKSKCPKVHGAMNGPS